MWKLARRDAVTFATCLLTACIALGGAFVVGPVSAGQEAEQPGETPKIEIEAILDRGDLERNEDGVLFVVVRNESTVTVSNVALSVSAEGFDVKGELPATTLPAFEGMSVPLTIRAQSAASGQHTALVSVSYSWTDAEEEYRSLKTSTVSVQVKRKFEDELGGLLGGGAAALYLLLPMYPAVAAYQLVDQWRKREALKVPRISTEYLVPAALVSVLVNLTVTSAFGVDYTENLLDVTNFFLVISLSAGVGGALAGIGVYQDWRWGYTGWESTKEYLRKALTGPRARRQFTFVTVKSGGESCQGILLEKGTDRFVLGAELEVTADPDVEREVLNSVDKNGTVHSAKDLIKLFGKRGVSFNVARSIQRGGVPENSVTVRVEGSPEIENAEQTVLIRYVS